jgi:C-terminal processing protease CtpA/Prc
LDARWLYRDGWAHWTLAERKQIEEAARKFKPEWQPPANEFSKWHYFVIKPNRQEGTYYYDRPVIILISTTNFSASDIFLGAFKGHKNITLMGMASGGGSGRYQTYRLHHSLINIGLSSMVSFQPNGKLYDGNGIQPDIIIEPIPTDFIGKTDSVLDAAIGHIDLK